MGVLVLRSCLENQVPAGSCKLEALKCTLALFGADKSHILNSQTTMSLILEALKNTTLPIGLDDISEKGQEMWKELVIDPDNNTSRSVKYFSQFSLLTGVFHVKRRGYIRGA